jgi:osmotically-inducible protein OsmY
MHRSQLGSRFAALLLASSAWAASAAQAPDPSADRALQTRVEQALHENDLFDRHIEVSVESGRVVLRGFVYSDWDLTDALRIARRVSGEHRIVDELTIKTGAVR